MFPPMAEELGGVPAAPEFPPSPTEAFADNAGAAGIDTLFGDSRFRDYDDEPADSENPFAGAAAKGKSPKTAGVSRAQKTLMWVAGSLVALLALLALFILGTKLPGLLGPGPEVIALPTSTPTPTPTEDPLGPVEPGDYRWDELLGGECLNPYQGPWEQEYTVVDCTEPHLAQLAIRGTFADESGVSLAYPGIEGLESQVNLLCTAPTVINYAKAAAYTDIQFEASFAATVEDWVSGDKHYYCFLSRSSGGLIDLDIAQPQVAPTPSPDPTESPSP